MTSEQASKGSILVVDDEQNILLALARLLKSQKYEVVTASSGDEALDKLETTRVDIVLSDVRMPKMDGIQLLTKVRELYPNIESILLTGYSDINAVIEAINLCDVNYYIQKPWDNQLLLKLIDNLFNQVHLKQANVRLQEAVNHQNKQLKMINTVLEEKVNKKTEQLNNANTILATKNQALKTGFSNILNLFKRLIDKRLSDYYKNSDYAVDLALKIARSFNLDNNIVTSLSYAVAFRFIGLIEMDENLIDIPFCQMTEQQKKCFRLYPSLSSNLLLSLSELNDTAHLILAHQELLDGSGYPNKLLADQLTLPMRIIAVVTAYEQLTNGLLLGEQLTAQEACQYLDNTVNRYDPVVIDSLNNIVNTQGEGNKELRLSVDTLTELMVLSRDFCNRQGMLLLAKGSVLDRSIIENLKQLEKRLNEALVLYVVKPLG